MKKLVALLLIFALLSLCGCGEKTAAPAADAQLVSFRFTTSGSSFAVGREYSAELADGAVTLSVCGEITNFEALSGSADASVMDDLAALINAYELYGWDGFSKGAAEDGFAFELTAEYSDGSSITARGGAKYPDGWQEAQGAIDERFASIAATWLITE